MFPHMSWENSSFSDHIIYCRSNEGQIYLRDHNQRTWAKNKKKKDEQINFLFVESKLFFRICILGASQMQNIPILAIPIINIG